MDSSGVPRLSSEADFVETSWRHLTFIHFYVDSPVLILNLGVPPVPHSYDGLNTVWVKSIIDNTLSDTGVYLSPPFFSR